MRVRSQATQDQASASRQITQAVQSVSTLTQQVNESTREHATGSRQILQAVGSMNRSAQEAAYATNLIAWSANDLQGQAGLLQAIAFFKEGFLLKDCAACKFGGSIRRLP